MLRRGAAGAFRYLQVAAAVFLRELWTLSVSPLGYVVAGAFLLLQGWNFSLLLHALNDPLAAPGPVMRYFFGGSFFVFWLPVAFVTSAIGMRTIAEERRSGTFETLMTAPVRPSQVVAGKYLACLAYFVFLWAPTASYVVMLRAAGAEPDLGPVAAGYVGTLAVGACFTAVALAASAGTRHQVSAAATAFVTILVLVLGGLWAEDAPTESLRRLASTTSLLAFMQDCAQGIVDYGRLSVLAAVTAAALWTAAHLADPRRDREGWIRGASVLVAASSLAGLGVRHLPRTDWTAARIYSLSEEAKARLSALSTDVEVTVLVPAVLAADRPNPLRRELREVLGRMAHATDRLRVRFLDPDREREQAEALVEAFDVSPDLLVEGVVLVAAGEGRTRRRTHLSAPDLVEYAVGPDAAAQGPRVVAFRGEAALLRAFRRVEHPREATACVTQGHGEPALDDMTPYGGLAHFERLLRDEGLSVRGVAAAADLAGCDLVVVPGPQGPLPAGLVSAIEEHLRRGRPLFVLAGAVLLRGADDLAPHGLESVLERRGIRSGARVVVDPHVRPGAAPLLAFTRDDGWSDAPEVAHLVGRPVSFVLARELSVTPAAGRAAPVVWFAAGAGAWAEADLAALRTGAEVTYDAARDRGPPLPLVVGSRGGAEGRLVVMASDQVLLNAYLRPDLVYDHGRDLLRAAVAFLLERDEPLAVEARPRERIKLVLRPAQLARMTKMAIFGPPVLVLLLGLSVYGTRRRPGR